MEIVHLDQQLVSRDPLDRFDHQISQSLLLLVLTHALLLYEDGKEYLRGEKWLNLEDAGGALHASTTRGRSGATAERCSALTVHKCPNLTESKVHYYLHVSHSPPETCGMQVWPL